MILHPSSICEPPQIKAQPHYWTRYLDHHRKFCLISAFLRLIRLSFSPTLPSALHYYLSSLVDLSRRSRRIRNLPRFFRLYLRVSIPSLSTPSALRSISMPFRFSTRTGLRPGCCTSSVISTNAFAYLPGLTLHDPRRLWKVQDSNLRCPTLFIALPSIKPSATYSVCLQPLGQPSFLKTSEPHGWLDN